MAQIKVHIFKISPELKNINGMGRKVQSNENISYGNDNMFILQLRYLA